MKKTWDKFHELYFTFQYNIFDLDFGLVREVPFAVFSYFITIVTMLFLCLRNKESLQWQQCAWWGTATELFLCFSITQLTHLWAIFSWLTGSKCSSLHKSYFSKRKREEKPESYPGAACLVLTDDERSRQKMTSAKENSWWWKRQEYLTFLTMKLFS